MRLGRLLVVACWVVLVSCDRQPLSVPDSGRDAGPTEDITPDVTRPDLGVDGLVDGPAHPPEGPPPLPDLVVQDLAASVSGATITYGFQVCNAGLVAASPVTVDLYHHGASPPPTTSPGDQDTSVPGLSAGACQSVVLKRTKTPAGTYSSWVRVDRGESVGESDEANNLAGPEEVTVEGPPAADLTLKSFEAQVSGADVIYTFEVCNEGTLASLIFRVEIYYRRALAPGPYMVGDDNVYFLGLGPGDCKSATRVYPNAEVGLYSSWAQVDALGWVPESDETNNLAGPQVVAMAPQAGCIALCTFAVTCGLVDVMELGQCLTWCNGFDETARTCATDAVLAQSCADFGSCPLPAKPLPPGTPFSCLDLCAYLVNTCGYLPQGQYLGCLGGCASLPSTKIQCGVNAMNNQQCAQMVLCLF